MEKGVREVKKRASNRKGEEEGEKRGGRGRDGSEAMKVLQCSLERLRKRQIL